MRIRPALLSILLLLAAAPATAVGAGRPPRRFVALVSVTGGSQLQVRSTATGALVRTLGTFKPETFLSDLALAPDGMTAYGAPTAGVIESFTASGRSKIANGFSPALSPDGRELAYQGSTVHDINKLVVRDLVSGDTRTFTVTRLDPSAGLMSPVWTSDHQLGVVIEPLSAPVSTLPGSGCGTRDVNLECLAFVHVPPAGVLTGTAVRVPASAGLGTAVVSAIGGAGRPGAVAVASFPGDHSVNQTGRLDVLSNGPGGIARVDQIGGALGLVQAVSNGNLLFQPPRGLAIDAGRIAGSKVADARRVLRLPAGALVSGVGW